MKTNWNDEIRARLRGCPREAKKALKAERDALVNLYKPRRPCADPAAARAACRAFDSALNQLGMERGASGPLH
jgi:hypothetical protein